MPPKKKTETGSVSLSEALSALRKETGAEIGAYDDFENFKVVGLPTGNLTIDTLTGVGGFPVGRITELIGPPSSGKTSSGLQAAGRVQQAGGVVCFLDFEKALDPDYATELGFDVRDKDSVVYMRPDSFEQGANSFRRLQESTGGLVDLVLHDSVAAMTTEHELAADTGAVQVADRAKMMYQYCRQLLPLLPRTNCAAVFLNHVLEAVDTTPMGRQMAARGIKKKYSPGGNAIPFYASLRLEYQQIGSKRTAEMDSLTNEEVAMVRQVDSKITVIKNKVGDTYMRNAETRIRFGHGFSQEYSVLTVLLGHGLIKKSGAWYKFPDPALRLDDDHAQIQGEDTVLSRMEENPEWFKNLEAKAKALVSPDSFDVADEADYADLLGQDTEPNEKD